jgi:glycosyltransferase involved in cell wall biosynthesis
MTAPLVTIVIPTFNRSGMLRRSIESALEQTQACEVIVVDHGSTDDTPAVAASFSDRIRYLRRDADHGVHFCWLEGVLAAKGEFVHINFDDDYMLPQFIEKCMALAGPSIAFVMSAASVRDEISGRTLSHLFDDIASTGVYPVSRFMRHQIGGLISPCALIIRRKDILDHLYVGGVPFARHEYRGVGPDWLMSAMATLRYPKFGYVNEPLVTFSSHDGSITIDAQRDATRHRALNLAYQQARKYYVITLLVNGFRLDLFAHVYLKLLQRWARLRGKLKRLFTPSPSSKLNE